MLNRIALAAASAAAALTLAVALAAAGFAPGSSQPVGVSATTSDPSVADPATAAPTVQVDTIYVAAPPAQETVTVHKVVRASSEASESEHEAGGDD